MISAAPEEAVLAALECIVPPDHVIGTHFHFHPQSGEVDSIVRVAGVREGGGGRGTLIVASVIPLGVMGGILALFLTGNTLSFTATIGFVALIGIEIKTSILLVDFTNQLRVQGMGLEDAIRRAGEVRFLPIVLTSLMAIGGLLPLALQGHGLYAPLAWVIIGGLVSSTVLARIVTPVLYKVWPPAIVQA